MVARGVVSVAGSPPPAGIVGIPLEPRSSLRAFALAGALIVTHEAPRGVDTLARLEPTPSAAVGPLSPRDGR